MTRFPTFFLSHGGGPWPFMEERREQYAKTAEEFRRIPARLPAQPKAARTMPRRPLSLLTTSPSANFLISRLTCLQADCFGLA